jgi:hypothetical protein
VDPLVEPVWSGLRVLVFLGHGRARFVDADGADLAVADDLPTLLGQALLAEEAVLEGYLVAGPPGDGTGIVPETVSPPPAGAFLRQMLLGGSARRALGEGGRRREGTAQGTAPSAPLQLAFVAVDVLEIDDQPLLDIPLLERKRHLAGLLREGERIRLGLYVRLPAESWFGSWRGMGLRQVTYKEANGRYTPGRDNPGCALADLPES